MDPSTITIVSMVFGFILGSLPRWFDRKRNLTAYWKVLCEEMIYCQKGAVGLNDSKVLSPLGRLPTSIYDEVLRHIIAEGDIERDEVQTLMRYYDVVRQVNESLNIIASAVERGDVNRATEEFGRTRLKTSKFASDHPDTIYAPALEIVNRHCAKHWWTY